MTQVLSIAPALQDPGEDICFYNRDRRTYGAFSNFYPAPINIDGVVYPTTEHLFQSCKAAESKDAVDIRKAKTPGLAKRMGRVVKIREDWESVKVDTMRIALHAKFTQHRFLYDLLLSTGDVPLHEDSPTDAFWGWMGGHGEDMLGKLLVELREELREIRPITGAP